MFKRPGGCLPAWPPPGSDVQVCHLMCPSVCHGEVMNKKKIVINMIIWITVHTVLAVLGDTVPFDYSWFGGRFLFTFVWSPAIQMTLTLSATLLGWFLEPPGEMSRRLNRLGDLWYHIGPLRAAPIALFMCVPVYLAIIAIIAPRPVQQGHGSLPKIVGSDERLTFNLPISETLPPPQTVKKRELPPRRPPLREPEPQLLEDVLSQLPVAEREEWEQAPRERLPIVIAPPVNVRLFNDDDGLQTAAGEHGMAGESDSAQRQLPRVKNLNAWIPREVVGIKRENALDAVDVHGGHQSSVVNLRARDGVQDNQASPFGVDGRDLRQDCQE